MRFSFENWQEKYKEKSIKPHDLAKIIKPGMGIYIGSGCSEPIALTSILADEQYKENFRDCLIFHFFSLSEQKFFDEKFPTRFRHNTLSIIGSPLLRDAVNAGRSDYTPIRSAEVPLLLKNHRYNIDVAIIQVSTPDRNGWCSLGINVDVNRAIMDVAKIVIAQINPQMPVTMGNSFIRFSDIDYFYYCDSPLLEYQTPEADEYTDQICKYITRLIDDGSTLNMGVGKICSALPNYLTVKKDLAIYSEFILETMIKLIDEGIVTCSKNTYPHCMTSFALGTKKSYDFYSNNPFIEFHPTDFITKIENIAANNKMVSVYSAMSVDLIGQVSNELKSRLYVGIGGEADFMRGTALCPNGKSIIALPSITNDGRSRILPLLSTQPVEVPAFDVHYVVTEYGIAYLHGKSLRERILQMIGVAHPKYRKWLLDAAKEYNFVYKDQKLPETQDGIVVIYPDIEWTFKTKKGKTILFRPVKLTDERMYQELYYSLSEKDRLMRFFKPQKFFSHEQTQNRILVDYHTKMVIVGLIGSEETSQRIIASAAYYLNPKTNFADISVTVHPQYRGHGIAKHLVKKLMEFAQKEGFSGICGDVMVTNRAMIHILKSLGYKVKFIPEGSSLFFEIPFEQMPNKKEV
ncbi:MAG: GNAT family N-acetyltransferase [Promethearchaeota archaeon]